MKRSKKDLLKGSGILVVVLSSIATSIYMVSTFADYEHYNIMVNKYEKQIQDVYKSHVESVDNYYSILEDKMNKTNDSFILE